LLVVVATSLLLSRTETVYWSETDLRLVYPGLKSHSNALLTTTESVIATAGLVVEDATQARPGPRLSTDEVTVVDAGIDDGVLIRLPNAGGQWATNFDKPSINIQVVGRDPAAVRGRMTETVAWVSAILENRQATYQVAKSDMITAYPSPPVPVVATAHGSRARALVAVLLVGLGLTIGFTLYVDQLMLRRRRRRRNPRTAQAVEPDKRSASRRVPETSLSG
jgi:hypothetical protein